MHAFPFLSLSRALQLLRFVVALLFVAHAVTRIVAGTIPQFAEFFDSKSIPLSTPLVWAITVFETVGGLLLAVGIWQRWLAALFILLLVVGIVLIHAGLGWWVGEHGTGGMEYSVALIAALIVIAAADGKKNNRG